MRVRKICSAYIISQIVSILLLILSQGLVACIPSSPPSQETHQPQWTLIPATSATASVSLSPTSTKWLSATATVLGEIDLTPAQSNQSISIPVGQVIVVENPGKSTEWQLDYEASILAPLAPSQELNSINPENWRLQAVALGQTNLVLTSISLPCSSNADCPPASVQFTFTIEVIP